jgi:hypothetical protein
VLSAVAFYYYLQFTNPAADCTPPARSYTPTDTSCSSLATQVETVVIDLCYDKIIVSALGKYQVRACLAVEPPKSHLIILKVFFDLSIQHNLQFTARCNAQILDLPG